ncbi:MAG TPA: BACON domain-containing carbohydrate-binding protein [Vicinamibacterales bacterium]
MTASAGCAWTATSNESWIAITSGANGTGNGPVAFSVAANTGGARTGTATIASQTFTVNQAAGAAACTYSISNTEANIGPDATQGTVSVIAGAGCTWTATSNASWITVASGATGTGNGQVLLTLAANTGAERTGTATIATRTFTVTQRAFMPACTYSISPSSLSVGPGDGSGTVSLSTGSGCSWTTVSSAAWLTVTQGASGSGNGVIAFSVVANSGAARTATLTIATQVFTLTQAAGVAPCRYAISPTSQTVPASGGSGTTNVTTAGGCAWTASSNVPWITVTSGASGTGNGSVSFTVAANTAASRSGTLTIGGQTFTVTQSAPASGP